MIKTCYLLFLVCFTLSCVGQTPDAYYGVVLTQIIKNDGAADTSRLLYGRNIAGDRLTAYTIREGVVANATAYQLCEKNNNLILYSSSIIPTQLKEDSLRVEFHDKEHLVVVNRTDRYILFPPYYSRFKQEVKVKHSIMALLNLLSDAIGDYPIEAVLPLLSYTPQLAQQIRQANIVTQRSQADMKDTWICHYYYNQRHQLDSVSASSPEEIRFHKKIRYNHSGVSTTTYLNIESRQETNRTVTHNKENHSLVESKESVYEIGKDRETILKVSLIWHDLGMLQNIDPSTAEVLRLLKPIKVNDDFIKKHID